MRSNVYIVGLSKCGKSPLAARLAAALGFAIVPGSEWIKARYVPSEAARVSVEAYITEITATSLLELAANPDACVDYIRAKYDVAEGGLVVDGLRNPRDFAMLYRPVVDLVLFLDYPANPIAPSEFERHGVAAIRANVNWLVDNGIASANRVAKVKLASIHGTDAPTPPTERYETPMPVACANLDTAMAFAVGWAKARIIAWPGVQRVHADLPRTRAWVENRVLYDDDPAHEGWSPCVMFGLSSYEGHAPTFSVLLGNGAMFHYVPPHRLRHADPSETACGEVRFDLSDLVYHGSRAGRIVVTAYEALRDANVTAHFKHARTRMNARYVATVDWVDGNDLLHVLALENGQFAMLPSHKVMVGDAPLPNYKKLRKEWRVGSGS